MLLCESVRENGAHLAAHGQNDHAFAGVRETFLKNVPEQTWNRHCKPSVKTLQDRFRSLMRERKVVNARNEGASGIVEDVSQLDAVMDDLLREKDDEKLKRKKLRDRMDAKEQALVAAGENIRTLAVERSSKRVIEEIFDSPSEMSSKKSPAKISKRSDSSFDEWQNMLSKELESQREGREKDFLLREAELKIQRERLEEEKKDREAQRESQREQTEAQKAQMDLVMTLVRKFS